MEHFAFGNADEGICTLNLADFIVARKYQGVGLQVSVENESNPNTRVWRSCDSFLCSLERGRRSVGELQRCLRRRRRRRRRRSCAWLNFNPESFFS
jgi:hypothetical protein